MGETIRGLALSALESAKELAQRIQYEQERSQYAYARERGFGKAPQRAPPRRKKHSTSDIESGDCRDADDDDDDVPYSDLGAGVGLPTSVRQRHPKGSRPDANIAIAVESGSMHLIPDDEWRKRAESYLDFMGNDVLRIPAAFDVMLQNIGGHPSVAEFLNIEEQVINVDVNSSYAFSSALTAVPLLEKTSKGAIVSHANAESASATSLATSYDAESELVVPLPLDSVRRAFYMKSCVVQQVRFTGQDSVPFTVHLARKSMSGRPLLVNPNAGAVVRDTEQVVDPNLCTICTAQLAPMLCVSSGTAASLCAVSTPGKIEGYELWELGSTVFAALVKFSIEVENAPRGQILDVLRRHDGHHYMVPVDLARQVREYLVATMTAAPSSDWCLVVRRTRPDAGYFPADFSVTVTLALSYFLNSGT